MTTLRCITLIIFARKKKITFSFKGSDLFAAQTFVYGNSGRRYGSIGRNCGCDNHIREDGAQPDK